MVPIPVCIEHLAFWDFADHMEISQLISSVEWLTCFLSEVMVSGKDTLKRALLKILDGCFSINVFFTVFLYFAIQSTHKLHSDLPSVCEYIYLIRIIFFSAVWKVYVSVLFLTCSLSVQLNHWWGHHLGVLPVSITQWQVEIGNFYTRFSRVSKSKSALLFCNYGTIAFHFVCWMVLTVFICGGRQLNLRCKNTKSSLIFHAQQPSCELFF